MSITVERIYDLIQTYDRSGWNPQSERGCVYTSIDGDHCLVGQVFVDLNLPVPDVDDGQLNSLSVGEVIEALHLEEKFDDDAIRLLRFMQQLADQYTHRECDEAWGYTIDAVNAWYDQMGKKNGV